MTRTPSLSVLAGTLAAALLVAGCGGTEFKHPASLAEARTDAARRGVPILLDFSTSW